APLIGEAATARVREILHQRRAMNATALEALRQQYPSYAELLERRILDKIWLRREETEYRALFRDGGIGPELYSALRRDIGTTRVQVDARPLLDLGLETRELISKVPMFALMNDDELDAVARLLRPRFALPGERLIRDGDEAAEMYFLSSGTVEVHVVGKRKKLVSGDFFGEMALISGGRREGKTTAMAYCQMLEPRDKDVHKLPRAKP